MLAAECLQTVPVTLQEVIATVLKFLYTAAVLAAASGAGML